MNQRNQHLLLEEVEEEEEDGKSAPHQLRQEAPPEWRETSQMFELLRSRVGGGAGGGAGLQQEQGCRRRILSSFLGLPFLYKMAAEALRAHMGGGGQCSWSGGQARWTLL